MYDQIVIPGHIGTTQHDSKTMDALAVIGEGIGRADDGILYRQIVALGIQPPLLIVCPPQGAMIHNGLAPLAPPHAS